MSELRKQEAQLFENSIQMPTDTTRALATIEANFRSKIDYYDYLTNYGKFYD